MLARMLNCAWLIRERAWLHSEPGRNTTRFDLETLAAILAFVEAKVNWAVIECGLGGRTDSSNVIDGEVCVLTNVDLEHTAVLGSSHSETRMGLGYGFTSSRRRDPINHPRIRRRAQTVFVCGKRVE
jgi:hypothetical protein